LKQGASRYTVALDVIQTLPADNLVVAAAYQKLLKRAANSDDLSYWAPQLLPAPNPGMRDEVFFSNVVASPEYGLLSTGQGYNSTPDQTWLNQVFQDTLGRAIDANGLAYYTLQIRIGMSYSGVVQSILSSQEYRTNEIVAAFTAILKRPPDPISTAYFVYYLNLGYSIEQVKALIYASPEFYVNAGASPIGYLEALYQSALNRPLDPNGIAFFGQQLGDGTVLPNIIPDPGADPVRESVALEILTTQEAYKNIITAAYPKFMHRMVDEAGLTYWTGALLGGLTDELFYAGLLSSQEYYTNFS
jgi:hypothetical protein